VQQVNLPASSSFELDVVLCSMSVIPLNTEAALFACLSSGYATTTGRLLGPKVGNSIKCLSQGHSDALLYRESNQGFATFRLLARHLYQLAGLSSHYPILMLNVKQGTCEYQLFKSFGPT